MIELDAATQDLARLLDSNLPSDQTGSAVIDRYLSAAQPFQAATGDDDAPDNDAPSADGT